MATSGASGASYASALCNRWAAGSEAAPEGESEQGNSYHKPKEGMTFGVKQSMVLSLKVSDKEKQEEKECRFKKLVSLEP